jgi:hypothetical protein
MTSDRSAATAAIQFALETDDGLSFLREWAQGSFSDIRRNWPDAPESVYIGVDPLHPKTKFGLEHDLRRMAEEVRALKSDGRQVSEIDRMRERELEHCASTMDETAQRIENGDYRN